MQREICIIWMKANYAIVPCQASADNEQQGKENLR